MTLIMEWSQQAREQEVVRGIVDAAIAAAGIIEGPPPRPAAPAPAASGSAAKPPSFVTQLRAVQQAEVDPLSG